MSYCRYRNTLDDLRDCYNAMNHENEDELSGEEKLAKAKLITLCVKISTELGDDGE